MLRDIGCEVPQPMARWLSKLLLPDEVLLDARIIREDRLLAFSDVRIFQLDLRDRGKNVERYKSVMLSAMLGVLYLHPNKELVVQAEWGAALNLDFFGELGGQAPFITQLISTVHKAQRPA